MNTSSRIHKAVRLERGLAERVTALRVEGESEADAYRRVIAAGVDALEQGEPVDEKAPETPSEARLLISSLQGHIETLKTANEALRGQLDVKDRQIESLSVLTAQAQQATTRALEAPADDDGSKRRGFFSRLFG